MAITELNATHMEPLADPAHSAAPHPESKVCTRNPWMSPESRCNFPQERSCTSPWFPYCRNWLTTPSTTPGTEANEPAECEHTDCNILGDRFQQHPVANGGGNELENTEYRIETLLSQFHWKRPHFVDGKGFEQQRLLLCITSWINYLLYKFKCLLFNFFIFLKKKSKTKLILVKLN